jgi:hypothetical protein
MAADPQITVRLPADMKVLFEGYATSNGLEGSQLAKLLIVRELRVHRLSRLKTQGLKRATRAVAASQATVGTITARFSSEAEVEEFDKYVDTCGWGRQTAAAWLLTNELTDRWLERALSRR